MAREYELAASRAAHAFAVVGRSLGRLVTREDKKTYEECHPNPNVNLCEQHVAATNTNAIVFGVIFGLLGTGLLTCLVWFHFRRKRMDQKEWSEDNHQELSDYGFESAHPGVSRPLKSRGTYATRPLDDDGEYDVEAASRRPSPLSGKHSNSSKGNVNAGNGMTNMHNTESLDDLARSISAKPPGMQEQQKKDEEGKKSDMI